MSEELKQYTGSPGIPHGTAPLSGQQMQALSNQHKAALIAIKHDIELRKWAVDQACGLAGAEAGTIVPDPVAFARSIHAFLVEGAKEPE